MLISHKYKFVFIGVPKTGSTSIRNSLSKYGDVFSSTDASSPVYIHAKSKELKNILLKMNGIGMNILNLLL